MAYVINKTDGTQLVVLQDAAVDSTTSLSFVGRNYVGYGEIQNENFLFLLENFANISAPITPIKGQVWFDYECLVLDHSQDVCSGTWQCIHIVKDFARIVLEFVSLELRLFRDATQKRKCFLRDVSINDTLF